ncbi:MAG TPA: hypothetical protein IAA43_05830 [Candidatus Olsenella avicola]|jgi:hypothetical protein|nr:hypothetical protein [Candidatus Olsenella avicola]
MMTEDHSVETVNYRKLWIAFLVALAFTGFVGFPVRASAELLDENPIKVEVEYGCSADTVMPRSWFGSSLSLSSSYTLPAHVYDGNNVGIEMTASCPVDGTFTVSLYRSSATGAMAFLGETTFKRNGFTKATWEGVGPGTYVFSCNKSFDGAIVRSNDVAMYSW